MGITERIESFFEKHCYDIQKSFNLSRIIGIYYFLGLLELTINGSFDNPSSYLKIASLFIELIVFLVIYYFFRKYKFTTETWQKRKITIRSFTKLLSLYLITSRVICYIISSIQGLFVTEDVVLTGTVVDLGFTPDVIIDVVIIGPIIEELILRGAGLSLFKKDDNKMEAIIFTSIIFGLMHGNIDQAIPSMICGLILGYLAVEYGIIYSIIFHMVHNGFNYLIYFINNSQIVEVIYIILFLLCICNPKKLINKLKTYKDVESKFSYKRLIVYFLHPTIFLYLIMWIVLIIVEMF